MPSVLGSRLIEARKARGLTQGEVADWAGITKRAYQLIESGVTASPRACTLHRLCKALGLDISEVGHQAIG